MILGLSLEIHQKEQPIFGGSAVIGPAEFNF
jgi:hypothetical protein